MRWAVVFHPEHIRRLPNGLCRLLQTPMAIAETAVPTALAQGWILIGDVESDVLNEPIPVRSDENIQSNPRRITDREDGA